MGYTKSEFFIVHDRDKPAVRRAHERAVEIFGSLVGPIMSASINFQDGFIVWTSGSKAGWPEAEEHSARIERLIEAMSKLEHPPRWVLASAGDDIDDMAIEQGYDGNWDHVYKRSSFGVTPGGKTGEGWSMARNPKRKPLTVKVSKGVLTIEIGVETLATAAIHSPWAFDALGEEGAKLGHLPSSRFKVRYPGAFAVEVRAALLAELGEDGSSILGNAIDSATGKAFEDGSLYFIDKHEEG